LPSPEGIDTPSTKFRPEARLPAGRLRLPHAVRAWIPTDAGRNRLKDYVLNPDHDGDGATKAALFKQRLGLVQDDWEYLHDQILDRVSSGWVRRLAVRIVPEDDPALCVGLRLEVHQPAEGRHGERCTLLTGWRLDARLAPFLTTTRPLRDE